MLPRLSSLTMRETDGTAKLLDLMGYLNDHVCGQDAPTESRAEIYRFCT